MNTPASTEPTNAVTDEPWYRRGCEIHDRRKQEADILRRIEHSLFREWRIIPPVALLTWAAVSMSESSTWNHYWVQVIVALLLLAEAVDHVGAVRTKALMEWMEYQKASEKLRE
jgi:hypothetical protein